MRPAVHNNDTGGGGDGDGNGTEVVPFVIAFSTFRYGLLMPIIYALLLFDEQRLTHILPVFSTILNKYAIKII